MKKILAIITTLSLFYSVSEACTNFLIGKQASVDGSTMITYAADSYYMYGTLDFIPPQKHKTPSLREIKDWETGQHRGYISQVKETFRVVSNMNEHQLSIAETTFGGRSELEDTLGLLDYGSLIQITLERCKNSREAIHTIASLVKQYGYVSSGESFSIADKNEIWIMEIIGKGVGNKGAVWVAQRIPDNAVSAHANQSRINRFPLQDTLNCYYSPDVIAFAKEKGYFSGEDHQFSFCDAYAPLDYEAVRICEARVWSFFRRIDQRLDSCFSFINGISSQRLPLWIIPPSKISLQTVKELMRDHYNDSPIDMTQGYGAGPFGSKLRCTPLTFDIDSVTYLHERPIATQQSAYTMIAQIRPWLPDYIGGIVWFGMDDAESSVYVPLYCSLEKVPHCFAKGNGHLLELSWESAFWVFNWVANMAYPRYNLMMKDISKQQILLEQKFDSLQNEIERTALTKGVRNGKRYLSDYSLTQAEKVTREWKKLGEFLLVKYLDGAMKREENGSFKQDANHHPISIIRHGYDTHHNRKIAEENPELIKKKILPEK